MNPQLNENDPALDRLLAGLASATPDAGFAQRVLHGVESRRVAAGPARYRRSAWTWGLASAAGFAVICTVVVLSYPRYGLTGQRRRDVANQSMRMPQAEPATLRVETLDQPGRRALRRIAGRPSKPVFDDQRSERVSFPAPPAPLTEQERLLLKIAHTGDPVEFAMLNPEVRAGIAARSDAEYEEFFRPPPPLKPIAKDDPTKSATPTTKQEEGDIR